MLLNLLLHGWLALLNLGLFIYWLPVIACLLGARFRDGYQLVPILLQLVFLLSPILYKKENLGAMAWTGELQGVVGIWVALKLLNRERPFLPFLI